MLECERCEGSLVDAQDQDQVAKVPEASHQVVVWLLQLSRSVVQISDKRCKSAEAEARKKLDEQLGDTGKRQPSQVTA